MLGWRVLLSAVIVPLLVLALYADARLGAQAPVLLVLCLLLAARSAWELASLMATRAFRIHVPSVLVCCVAVVVAAWLPHWMAGDESSLGPTTAGGPILAAYVLCVLLLLLKEAVRYREPGGGMETVGGELLIVSYVGVLLAVTAQLRWVAGADAGYLALGSLIVAAKCGDIGAYTLGRLFGRRKMAPQLSPGKTWAGAVGGVLGAALAGWAWMHWATPAFHAAWKPPAAVWSLAYGATIGVVGLVGDLCESLIKRDVGAKDAASLMPGFGGVLDLLDSVLYAGPVAYLLWLWWPLKTW